MQGTEATFLWIKVQMGSKDMEAMNILKIFKNIDWKEREREREDNEKGLQN